MEKDQVNKEHKKEEPWKGVLFMNLYSLLLAICCLISRYLFLRNPDMQPEAQLFMRTFMSNVMLAVYLNRQLPHVAYSSIPSDQMGNLAKRALQASLLNIIEFSVLKYIALVFQGVAYNLNPVVTTLLAYFLENERPASVDLVFMICLFAAVFMVTLGYSMT